MEETSHGYEPRTSGDASADHRLDDSVLRTDEAVAYAPALRLNPAFGRTSMKQIATLSVAILFATRVSAGDASHPPARYVDEGACPFECCTYREWAVEETTTLLGAPNENAKAVGVVAKGERVVALTGNVETVVPGRIQVLRSFRSATSKVQYKMGDIVWVYTSLGEGFYRVWYRGEFHEEEAAFFGAGSWNRCTDEGTCWGKPIRLPKSIWWVKLKTAGGLIGWSKEPGHFGNKDACG